MLTLLCTHCKYFHTELRIFPIFPVFERLSLRFFFFHQTNLVYSLGVCLRAVGVEEQQYKQWGVGAGSACQSGCSSWRLLEVSASPAPATLPQVQHLPGQGRTVWGLHAERPASFTCSGEQIASCLVSSLKGAMSTYN